jgi:hypothetical protein
MYLLYYMYSTILPTGCERHAKLLKMQSLFVMSHTLDSEDTRTAQVQLLLF